MFLKILNICLFLYFCENDFNKCKFIWKSFYKSRVFFFKGVWEKDKCLIILKYIFLNKGMV